MNLLPDNLNRPPVKWDASPPSSRSVAVPGHCNIQFAQVVKFFWASGRLDIAAAGDGRTPRSAKPAARPAAFTLIEVLVVVTLLSIVVLALMDVFNATQRAFRAAVTQTDVLEGSRAAMDLITSDLRTMTPSDGVNFGPVNFFALDNNYNSALGNSTATYYSPLQQALPGGGVNRTNLLQYFFVLGRQNTQWTGVGYVVDVTNTSTLYPLYRFYAQTNITQSPLTLFQLFNNTINSGGWTNMSHIMDGVVHLVVRPYDINGVWLTNGYSYGMKPPTNSVYFLSPTYGYGEVGCYFYSNAIPASVELQMAVVEDRTLQRAESLPTVLIQSNYLASQSGAVHVFRQIVTIPNVDRSAYQ